MPDGASNLPAWFPVAAGPLGGLAGAVLVWLSTRRKNSAEADKAEAEANKAHVDAATALAQALDDRIKIVLDSYEATRRMDRETIESMRNEIAELKEQVERLTRELHQARMEKALIGGGSSERPFQARAGA
jgi:uncharacterized membrane protein